MKSMRGSNAGEEVGNLCGMVWPVCAIVGKPVLQVAIVLTIGLYMLAAEGCFGVVS